MKNSILEVENLTKIFFQKKSFLSLKKAAPSYTAVNRLNFQLKEGEILGILGSNGAGKTTTIQMLLGTLTPTSGEIRYFGKNFIKNRSELLQHISHASSYNKLPGFLTIEESLEIYARLYGLSHPLRKSRIKELLDFFGISKLAKERCRTLSAGQMTRLMLVKAFISHPKIVLLDEPTASLDPEIASETRQFILEQQRKFNVAMIITSHNMQEVTEVCNRVLVLKDGMIIEQDSPQKLARSVSLSKLHLTFTEKFEEARKFMESHGKNVSSKGPTLSFELDENDISKFLIALAQSQFNYSHIDIVKPSLEDYFLHISKR